MLLVVIRIYLLKKGDSNFPLEKCEIGYATEFNWAVLEPVGFGLTFIETDVEGNFHWPDLDVDIELDSLDNLEAYPLVFNS